MRSSRERVHDRNVDIVSIALALVAFALLYAAIGALDRV
jgi:hypothetical protein